MQFVGIIISIFLIAFSIFLLYMIYVLLYTIFFGAPFAASRDKRIKNMLSMLELKKGDKFADLGSGDGRIVIAVAKMGIESHGYEMNPFLVLISRSKIRKAGLKNKAFIHRKSFWDVNLSDYSAITVFGIKHIMPYLEKKLSKELKKKSRVSSNYFKFPNLKIKEEKKGAYLYHL